MYQTFVQNHEQIQDLQTTLFTKEMEAREKEEKLREERDTFRKVQKDKDSREEQFLNDQHTYKKEIESLRDRNCELVLKQQEVAQEHELKQEQMGRINKDIERID